LESVGRIDFGYPGLTGPAADIANRSSLTQSVAEAGTPCGQKIETAAVIEAVAKAPGQRVAERIFGCHSLNATRRQGPRGNA
jgi:hypothetical protein